MSGSLRLITREGESHLAKPGQTLTIGRKKGCDIVIGETTISRQHARVEIMDNTWHVTDLDSSNGTFVNGRRVAVSELKNGDEVRTGSVPFLVEIEEIVVVGGPTEPQPAPGPLPMAVSPPAGRPPPPKAPEAEPPARSPASGRVKAAPEKPRRRAAKGRREKEDPEPRRRQSRSTASTRRERPRPDKKNMTAYYALGGSFGFFVIVLAVIIIFSGNKPRRPLPAPPPVRPPAGGSDLAEARRLYNEAAALMMKKEYKKAWPVVDRAHTLHMQLLDKPAYRNNAEIQNHGRDLSIWRRQTSHVGNQEVVEEMERIKRSTGH